MREVEGLLTHMESTATQDEEDGAVYCEWCEMWLNGPTQWEDHKIGKKHKKNIARRKKIGGPVALTPVRCESL